MIQYSIAAFGLTFLLSHQAVAADVNIRGVAPGMTVKEFREKLGVSVHTVREMLHQRQGMEMMQRATNTCLIENTGRSMKCRLDDDASMTALLIPGTPTIFAITYQFRAPQSQDVIADANKKYGIEMTCKSHSDGPCKKAIWQEDDNRKKGKKLEITGREQMNRDEIFNQWNFVLVDFNVLTDADADRRDRSETTIPQGKF